MNYQILVEQPCFRCGGSTGKKKDKKLLCCNKCKPMMLKELKQLEKTKNSSGVSMLKNEWRNRDSVYLTQSDISKYFGLTIDAIKRMPVGRVIKEATRLAHTGNLLINLLKEKKH